MALSKNINYKGIEVEGAYFKISDLFLSKEIMNFKVEFKASKDSEFLGTATYTCSYNIEGENPFVQAYNYLKTLDEFKDSEDC